MQALALVLLTLFVLTRLTEESLGRKPSLMAALRRLCFTDPNGFVRVGEVVNGCVKFAISSWVTTIVSPSRSLVSSIHRFGRSRLDSTQA